MDDSNIAIIVFTLLAIGLFGLAFLAGYELGYNKRGWIESKNRYIESLVKSYIEFKSFPTKTSESDKRKVLKIMGKI